MHTSLETHFLRFVFLKQTKSPESINASQIEVFKTNVDCKNEASHLLCMLLQFFPHYDLHFDLEDCDKILRVENPAGRVEAAFIQELLLAKGYQIEVLED